MLNQLAWLQAAAEPIAKPAGEPGSAPVVAPNGFPAAQVPPHCAVDLPLVFLTSDEDGKNGPFRSWLLVEILLLAPVQQPQPRVMAPGKWHPASLTFPLPQAAVEGNCSVKGRGGGVKGE